MNHERQLWADLLARTYREIEHATIDLIAAMRPKRLMLDHRRKRIMRAKATCAVLSASSRPILNPQNA